MRLTPVIHLLAWALLGLAVLMTIPGLIGTLLGEPEVDAFFLAASFVLGIGILLLAVSYRAPMRIYPRQTFLLTSVIWLSVSVFSAVPLMLIGHISYTDAFFEAMSGISTTGSTVLTGLDQASRSVLLWRSMLQWVGGLGFVLMAVAILPFLGVGGMRLFRSESSDWSEKAMPRVRNMALSLGVIYAGLSASCGLAYWLAGMSPFEAVNHAMTTVATGGYSTSDGSMGHFTNPAIHWIGVVFMVLASLPFVLYVRALRGQPGWLLQDEQVRGFLLFLTLTIAALTLWLMVEGGLGLGEALRLVAFNSVSIVTTTGYATTNYTLWGPLAVMVFFYLMFVGGCSGSTAGSMKVFRMQIGLRVLGRQLVAHIHPRGVFPLSYNGRPLAEDIIRSVVGFSFAFFTTIALLALLLGLLGLDFLTSLSAATTAVANVGPGLGDVIGPDGNFASIPDLGKWALSLGMLLGRLEIMTVAVLFSRQFWQS